jgi:Bacterial dnaA protein helix-turn-helix
MSPAQRHRARKARLWTPPRGHFSTELEIKSEPAKRTARLAERRWRQQLADSLAPFAEINPLVRATRLLVVYQPLSQFWRIKFHRGKIRVQHIQRASASFFGLTTCDLVANRRDGPAVYARHVAMYLARVMTLKSFPEIGRLFNGRDHSTIVHAVGKIAAKIVDDRELADEVAYIHTMLEDYLT